MQDTDAVRVENDGVVSEPPPVPESVSDVGVPRNVLEDLALKTLHFAGSASLRELATKMTLPFVIIDELLRRLRAEQLCEVTGMTGNIPQIAITSPGRTRALELLRLNQYVGAAPVSLDSYVQMVRRQSVRSGDIHLPEVRRAFSHLVLDEKILKKLGAAVSSGSSIFLYGPSGTGKTVIATTLSHLFGLDPVWVPFAVEVEGQIISVYDRQVHARSKAPTSQSSDGRWVLCKRPAVVAGGELNLEMLELQLNPITRFYSAPVQMKANNGALIIDDFGRQRMRPEELLNRWIVPLDRRIDFLTLAGGKKVEIPFELFIVFATNLDPATLADAAFLRRIQTKIKMGNISEQQFHQIFRNVCMEQGLQYEASVIDDSIDLIQNGLKEPLRGCHPRDIVNQVLWAARFEEREPRLDREALRAAVDAYFVLER